MGEARGPVMEREELLVEGMRVMAGEYTREAARECVEPCEAKLPTELLR